MKKIILFLLIFVCSISLVFAQADLIIELEEPVILPKTGFGQAVFLPYKVTNIGDEPVTSRFPIKSIDEDGRSGVGHPLYIYTGEMQIEGKEPLQKAPIELADGSVQWRPTTTTQVDLGDGIIPNAPAVELNPGESLLFTDFELIGGMSRFYFQDSGTYTIGYEIDPVDHTNEIAESNDENNKATTQVNLEVQTFIKGPNEEVGLDENQYWFFFKNEGDCVELDLPQSTKICLVSQKSFTSVLSVDDQEIKIFHIFEWFSFKKTLGNLEFVGGDGFLVTYQ